MAPTPSPEPAPGRRPPALSAPARAALLTVARASVERGLREGLALAVDPDRFDPSLRARGASFVTLRVEGQLRGCTGALEPVRPLVADVAHNAWAAAFRDPRFPPLRAEERAGLALHLAILGPQESLVFASEAELLGQLEPHVHGLWIEAAGRRATFLPAVWAELSDPEEFLAQLKRKAGLADPDALPLRAARYRVQEISEPAG